MAQHSNAETCPCCICAIGGRDAATAVIKAEACCGDVPDLSAAVSLPPRSIVRRRVAMSPPCAAALAPPVQVPQLRTLVAREFRIAKDRLRLVTGGKTLQDGDTAPIFRDEGGGPAATPGPCFPHLPHFRARRLNHGSRR